MKIEDVKDPFLKAILQEDTLGAVVRAQIHIEVYVNDLIDLLLVDPKAIKQAKLEYRQACILVVALGLEPEMLPVLNFLGELRNKFAHDLDKELTKNDMDNFYKCFSKHDKEIIQSVYNKIKSNLNDDVSVPLNKRNARDRFACYVCSVRAAILVAIKEAKS